MGSSKKTPSKKVLGQNVGIDFAKDDFKACMMYRLEDNSKKIKASRTFKNTLSGFKLFHKWVKRFELSDLTFKVTLEPTGIYHENFLYYFHESSDYELCLVVPNQSKAFAKSLGVVSKTDKVDAEVLAKMGLERNLTSWEPISSKMRVIKQLCRERVRLLKQKTALINQEHALEYSYDPNKFEMRRIARQKKYLDKLIKEVEVSIKKAIKADADLSERIKNICELKGVRQITVATIIAETDGFRLFKNRNQLISYAGYDVVERESGTSVKGRTKISKKGNSHIRRALHFPAIVASEHDPKLKQLYERVWQRSGIKMKGLVAVQRKILILVYTIYKKNEKYDPNYQATTQKKEVAAAN